MRLLGVGCLLLLVLSGCDDEGCAKDTDCAEGRICGEDDRCVDADDPGGPSQERCDNGAAQICDEAAKRGETTPCAEPVAEGFETACAAMADLCGVFQPNAQCDIGD